MSVDTNNNLTGEQESEFEINQNLIGLFDLLIKIDKRNNPKLYEDNDISTDPDSNHD